MYRLLATAPLLLLVACSDAKEMAFHEVKDLPALVKEERLTQEEADLVGGYVVRSGFSQELGDGSVKFDSTMTLGEIIEKERGLRREDSLRVERERLEAEAAAKRREAELQRLRNTVTVTFLDKGFLGSNYRAGRYSDYITTKYAFKNNSVKAVSGVKGRMIFNDQFGDEVFSSGVKINDRIPAGERIIWEGVIDYNQFIDDHERFRFAEKEKLTMIWEPEVVLFEDGTKLEVPVALE